MYSRTEPLDPTRSMACTFGHETHDISFSVGNGGDFFYKNKNKKKFCIF